MALQFKTLQGQEIQAFDGRIGKAKDVLFDDRTWRIRYIVVDTGDWLTGRKVLIAPASFSSLVANSKGELTTHLTKQNIEDSPPLESDQPVSRQQESSLHAHYGWAPYWPLATNAANPYPDASFDRVDSSAPLGHADWEKLESTREKKFNGHLRSLDEITGYKIGTRDDQEFGEVKDAIIEGRDWLIIDLILNSIKWLPGGKKFICSPMFVNEINQRTKVLHLEQTKQMLLDGPTFDFETYGESYRKELVRHYCNLEDGVPSKASSMLYEDYQVTP